MTEQDDTSHLEHLADVVDHIPDRLERRVVARKETLEAEDGVLPALGRGHRGEN
jgi:hypothetical protein